MEKEVALEFPPLVRIYKDGTVERLLGTQTIPARDDPETGMQCQDTTVSTDNNLSARIYLPKIDAQQQQKIPLIIYIHGGGFCVQSPFSPSYYGHLVALASKANVIIAAIEYRKAPEHLLPIAYDDSWDAVKWIGSHVGGNGPVEWFNKYADFERVWLVGEASGANIAHSVMIRSAVEELPVGFKLVGMALVQPYFEDEQDARLKYLDHIYPSKKGWADPMINPVGAGREHLASLPCSKVLVSVASEDTLVGKAGVRYYVALKNSGWSGQVKLLVTEGEGHIFHLKNPMCDKAVELMDWLKSSIQN